MEIIDILHTLYDKLYLLVHFATRGRLYSLPRVKFRHAHLLKVFIAITSLMASQFLYPLMQNSRVFNQSRSLENSID